MKHICLAHLVDNFDNNSSATPARFDVEFTFGTLRLCMADIIAEPNIAHFDGEN